MKIEIQHRLEAAERNIFKWKEKVCTWDRYVNRCEGELKKEGELTVFQSLTVSTYSTIDYIQYNDVQISLPVPTMLPWYNR